MRKFKTTRCKIRQELLNDDLGMPINKNGETMYLHQSGTFQYRWLDTQFQIKFMRKWYDAMSIDFEFIN